MLRLCLCLSFAFAAASSAEVSVRKAVFSDRQLFWPELAGQGRPAPMKAAHASAQPAGANGARGQAAAMPRSGAGKVSPAEDAVRLAVLPFQLKEYSEAVPCDSCHRLSANGMEFFLENYLRQRMEARLAGREVRLIAPSDPLVEKRADLMAYLDSLGLPWDRWLADSGEAVVYRPRDRFTDAAARKRMDKLGGLLGATHLLLPARAHMRVKPVASDMHMGGLEWGFCLVLWNVAEGSPEWAFAYEESEKAMDLDESLEGRLDKALGAAFDKMPSDLRSLWASEPH